MMPKNNCRDYRFPPEIIQQALWLFIQFNPELP
jgi:hypothetical protein